MFTHYVSNLYKRVKKYVEAHIKGDRKGNPVLARNADEIPASKTSRPRARDVVACTRPVQGAQFEFFCI